MNYRNGRKSNSEKKNTLSNSKNAERRNIPLRLWQITIAVTATESKKNKIKRNCSVFSWMSNERCKCIRFLFVCVCVCEFNAISNMYESFSPICIHFASFSLTQHFTYRFVFINQHIFTLKHISVCSLKRTDDSISCQMNPTCYHFMNHEQKTR